MDEVGEEAAVEKQRAPYPISTGIGGKGKYKDSSSKYVNFTRCFYDTTRRLLETCH